jgi:hypothetical protein
MASEVLQVTAKPENQRIAKRMAFSLRGHIPIRPDFTQKGTGPLVDSKP